MSSQLLGGQELPINPNWDPAKTLTSPSGNAILILQGDGNLVTYQTNPQKAVWEAATTGKGGDHLIMQGDGNLVLYKPGGDVPANAVWSSGTGGTGADHLTLQDDLNLVLYKAGGDVEANAIWVNGHIRNQLQIGQVLPINPGWDPGKVLPSLSGNAILILQGDGNLVTYQTNPQKAVWEAATTGKGGDHLIMQGDGNLVLYKPGGDVPANAVWSSGTGGTGAHHLTLQDDLNLVLYTTGGDVPANAVWADGKPVSPPPPTFLGAVPTSVSIQVRWQGPPGGGVDHYLLGWSIAATGEGHGEATTTDESFVATGLTADTTYEFALSYFTHGGRRSSIITENLTTESGPPPPLVTVPSVTDQTVTQARNALQHVGLNYSLINPTTEIRSDYLKVVNQSPKAGARVPSGTSVELLVTAIAQPIPGYAQVVVDNENGDGRAVEAYLIDLATNNPQDMGAVAVGTQKTVTLQDGHEYEIVAVDVGLIGCPGSDPTNQNCQRALTYAPGQTGGPSLTLTVS
jgi:hypothetical protein